MAVVERVSNAPPIFSECVGEHIRLANLCFWRTRRRPRPNTEGTPAPARFFRNSISTCNTIATPFGVVFIFRPQHMQHTDFSWCCVR